MNVNIFSVVENIGQLGLHIDLQLTYLVYRPIKGYILIIIACKKSLAVNLTSSGPYRSA